MKNILLHNIYFLSLKSSYSSYSTFVTHWRIDFSNWCWEPLCKITCSTVQTRNSEIIVCIPLPPARIICWWIRKWSTLNRCWTRWSTKSLRDRSSYTGAAEYSCLMRCEFVWFGNTRPQIQRHISEDVNPHHPNLSDWKIMFTKITFLLLMALTICKSWRGWTAAICHA